MRFPLLLVCRLIAASWASQEEHEGSTSPPDYGVDSSYPMHYATIVNNYPWLPHNVDPSLPTPPEYTNVPLNPLGIGPTERYNHYIQGCVDFYNAEGSSKGKRCLQGEKDRIEMTRHQPASVYNYTDAGYAKLRAPARVMQLLTNFWQKNKDQRKNESWPVGNIYTNHWEVPTELLSVDDKKLVGAGPQLKQQIWNAARDTLEAWTGHRLAECSLYGIRIYNTGAMLAPHVDRFPLVSSAIINVDQDTDEPWPLEVIGHDGRAHNVTMEPGDMVLYESHSIIHGRQFPLQGRFMANVFIHFEPVGPIGGQVQITGDLPPYIIPGTEAERKWRESNPTGHKIQGKRGRYTTGSTELHHSAQEGDTSEVERLLAEKDTGDDDAATWIDTQDVNGWSALHEAVRSGATDIVRLLLHRGANPQARTGKKQTGDSALALAKRLHGDAHAVVQQLIAFGATDVAYGSEL